MVIKKTKQALKKGTKKLLDKTNIDDKLLSSTKKILDKTSVDDHILKSIKKVKKEYRKTLVTAMSAGLAFIIALYIRDILKGWIELIIKYFDLGEATGLIYQSIIALIVVALCVLGIIFLGLWQEKNK